MRMALLAYRGAIEAVAVTGTIVVLVVGALQVWFRYMTDASLVWTEEVMRYTMLWLVMLCAGLAYSNGLFLGMRSFVSLLPKRLQRVCDIVSGLLMIGFLGLIAWYGAFFSWRTRLQTAVTIDISLFWIHIAISVGALLLVAHVFAAEVLGRKRELTDEESPS